MPPSAQFKNLRQPLKTLASRARKGVYRASSLPLIPVVTDRRGPVRREWESVGTILSALESERLAADYVNGMRVVELSRKYGLHRSTVYRHLQKHGLERRSYPLDDVGVDRARELYETGYTLAEVAEFVGSSCRTVRETFVARGISRRAPLESTKKQREPRSLNRLNIALRPSQTGSESRS